MIETDQYVYVINVGAKNAKGATNEQTYKCGEYSFPPRARVKVPLSFIGNVSGIKALKIDFSPLADQFRSRTDDGRIFMDWYCPLSVVDGYGRHALTIYEGLQRIGVDAQLYGTDYIDRVYLPVGLERTAMDKRRLPAKVSVCMTIPYDPYLCERPNLIKIALTQFETDHVPAKHVERINKCDHLIVTSSFQPPIMRRSGVTIPIDVLTPGVDTDFFEYAKRPYSGQPFNVLILGALTGRKDPEGTVRIFQKASQGDTNWHLTIKTRRTSGLGAFMEKLGWHFPKRMGKHEMEYAIPYPFTGKAPVDDRVTLIVNDEPPLAVRNYYYSHNVLLWPSRGEGCGLPPLEAMATGMEVVSSDHSGLHDFIDARWAWPIRTAKTERADIPGTGFSQWYVDLYGSVGNWWVPDHDHAVVQLRRAHDAWKRGEGKGEKAAQYVREHHTLEHQARSVAKVVEKYV